MTYLAELKRKNPVAYQHRIRAGAPGTARRNMIRALSMMRYKNTPEENQRLASAKWCNKHGF